MSGDFWFKMRRSRRWAGQRLGQTGTEWIRHRAWSVGVFRCRFRRVDRVAERIAMPFHSRRGRSQRSRRIRIESWQMGWQERFGQLTVRSRQRREWRRFRGISRREVPEPLKHRSGCSRRRFRLRFIVRGRRAVVCFFEARLGARDFPPRFVGTPDGGRLVFGIAAIAPVK